MSTLDVWFNDQILKMVWLNNLVKSFVENVLGLETADRIGGSVQFFLYDTIKIFILLSFLIFTITSVALS